MATVKRNGHICMVLEYGFAEGEERGEAWRPRWYPYKPDAQQDRIYIGEHTLICDIPSNFDPREKQIAALEAQKRDITAKFTAAVTELNARISKLQAITYEAA